MSFHEYVASRELVMRDLPFYSLIMAAMHKADTTNAALLRNAFPDVWDELAARYNAPGGKLAGEP